jgi:hypothetical protein
MELVRLGLARLAPRRDQMPGGGEAMDPGIAVAVGHVEVARRRRDHLGRIVERAGRAGNQLAGALTPGVGVRTPLAQHLERLAVQGVGEADRIVPVGEVHHVLGDVDAMRIGERPDAPAV